MKQVKHIVLIVVFLLVGCSSQPVKKSDLITAPLGLYRTDTTQKFWLAILQNNKYLICSPSDCNSGLYETVAVNHGIILLDFYLTEIGKTIEPLLHGNGKSAAFINAMQEIRQQQPRPNDQVFNLTICEQTPCVRLGHGREGVTFYRVEDFNAFWESRGE